MQMNGILKIWATAAVLLGISAMAGCSASEMMAMDGADFSRSAAPKAGEILCGLETPGGCFHGSMTCDSVTLVESGDERRALCYDAGYVHEASGQSVRALCVESENANGEPCQICQTQEGAAFYDDCVLAPEEVGDCRQEPQYRDAGLMDCTICTDDDGNQISETCIPANAQCQTGIEKGPYLCQQCTNELGELIFSECSLKRIDPAGVDVYQGEDWLCVDYYDSDRQLLRHHCMGGDADAEKQPLIEDDEEAMTADASPESEGEEAVGAGNSGEGEPATGEGATDAAFEGTDESQDCEETYPDPDTRCLQCWDDAGNVLSEECAPVDRRMNRCERVETANEVCIFCTNELGELVTQSCEPKPCEGDRCDQTCMTGTQDDRYCRFCGANDAMEELSEVSCMTDAPALVCDYVANYVYGQAGEETCLVCTAGESSVPVYRRCEGRAGGLYPKPPVCAAEEDGTCTSCEDPYFGVTVFSICEGVAVAENTVSVNDADLACTSTNANGFLVEALCLRDHCCGAAVLLDEASGTYGADPLCGDTQTVRRSFEFCPSESAEDEQQALAELMTAAAADLGSNVVALAANNAITRRDACTEFQMEAVLPAAQVLDGSAWATD